MSDTDTDPEAAAAEPSGEDLLEVEVAYGAPVSWSRGQRVLHPGVGELVATVEAMKADGYVSAVDLCVVDYLDHPGRGDLAPGVDPERFELVITLISHALAERTRLRVQVPESDPVVPSLFDVFPGTEGPEREAFDMFGLTFVGHPDHTRILMPEDWQGHPLRKDYAVGSIPVQFKGAPAAR